MSQRSPYNDRYKVEQKGKTRKSASAAKPKRAVADLTPAEGPVGKASSKRRWWQPNPTSSSSNTQAIPVTPQMRKLRRLWWIMWGASLALAVVILLLQQAARSNAAFSPFVIPAWAAWLGCMAVAFYLEFVPLRKARLAAVEAARSGDKGGKKSGDKQADKGTGE
jgi:hypothetical protein